MWCTDCQQDVPAVVRSAREPLVCPRCQQELAPAAATVPSDAGIALESFDQPVEDSLAPPIDWLAQEETRQRLRAIDQKLHAPHRQEIPKVAVTRAGSTPLSFAASQIPLQTVTHRAAAEPTAGQRPTKTSWSLSLLLSVGVLTFCGGVGLLAWSTAFQLPLLWQQGMTLTIGAEGLLILSLTWMAARLWRNGRRVNRQLHGVDQQLAEIEQITGALAGSQVASSQHFYHHASQAASPHMLVSNLQGQVEQLAARL